MTAPWSARIGRGVVLLVGVERGDSEADADVTARKIAALRIFAGRTPMDLTLAEVGRRLPGRESVHAGRDAGQGQPPQLRAGRGARARRGPVPARGRAAARRGPARRDGPFGADMQVDLVNDGPVTFLVFTAGGALVHRA